MDVQTSQHERTGYRLWRLLLSPRLLVCLLLVAVLAAGAVFFLRKPPSPLTPPEIDLTGADPEVAEVITAAREAVIRAPNDAAEWGRLGMVLRAHDYGSESVECFAQAERFDPENPRWPYLRGVTILLTDPEKGIACLEQAVGLMDSTPTALRLRLAEALLARGRLADAENHFRQVLQTEPDNPRALLGLGRLAYKQNDLTGSLPYLRRVSAGLEGRREARQLLAAIYYRLGDKGALKELGDVAGLPPDPPWRDPYVAEVESLRVGLRVRIELAFELRRENRVGEALAVLEDTVAARPNSAQAWLALGETFISLNQFAAAERPLRRHLDLAPKSVEGWFLVGVSLYKQGNKSEAASCFRQTVALKPDHADAHFNLGHCMKETDREGAIQAFRAALRSRPGYAEAQKALNALMKNE